MNTLDISRWLGDFYLLSTLLLGGELLACRFAGQPARRMALAWATAGGLAVLALLCALPGWSNVHLFPPAPPEIAPQEYLQPLAGQAIKQNMGFAPSIPADSPMPPLPLEAEPVPFELVIDWTVLALYLLAAGSAVVIAWLTLGAWQVRRLRKAAGPAPENILAMLRELTPAGMSIPAVGVLETLPVAVAVGLRNPAILLPHTLVEQARTEQMRTVLAHELAHLRHRDLWLMAGVRLLLVLLWAHPLFWLWRRRVRLDQEVLADTAAAELTSRTVYAEELVELARYAGSSRVPRLASSVGLWETRSQLKRRLALLLDEKLTILRSCSRGWRVGSLVVLLGLAGGLSLVTLTPAEPKAASAESKQAQSTTKETDWQRNKRILSQLNGKSQPNTITGICVDERGEPLKDVDVEVYTSRPGGASAEPTKILAAKTNAEGRFHFEDAIDIAKQFPDGLPDENFVPYGSPMITIVARKTGRVPRVDNDLALGVVKQGMASPFRMPPSQRLRGRIVDEHGQPVAGARVTAGQLYSTYGIPDDMHSAKTDDKGEFVIQDVEAFDGKRAQFYEPVTPPAGNAVTIAGEYKPWERWLWVKHPKNAMKRTRIETIPGNIDSQLERGAVLTGQVLTQEAGQSPLPARNVEVHLEHEITDTALDGEHQRNIQTTNARTDAQGRYRFDSLPPGVYSCATGTPGWVAQGIDSIELQRGETKEAPNLVLTRGGQVRFQLIEDATGEPMTFEKPTKVYVVPQPRPRKPSFFMTSSTTLVEFSTDGVGEQQLLAGDYAFHVNLPGWVSVDSAQARSVESLPTHTVKEGEVLDLLVRLKRGEITQRGNVTFASPPSDVEKPGNSLEKDRVLNPDRKFVPILPDGIQEIDRDAYENGVFVPDSVPSK